MNMYPLFDFSECSLPESPLYPVVTNLFLLGGLLVITGYQSGQLRLDIAHGEKLVHHFLLLVLHLLLFAQDYNYEISIYNI